MRRILLLLVAAAAATMAMLRRHFRCMRWPARTTTRHLCIAHRATRLQRFVVAPCEGDGAWANRAVAVCYLCGLAWLLVALTLHVGRLQASNRLSEAAVLRRYGFLYRDFRTRGLYWGIARLWKQALLVTITVALWRHPAAQGVAAVLVITGNAVAEAWVRPNLHQDANVCEIAGGGDTLGTGR